MPAFGFRFSPDGPVPGKPGGNPLPFLDPITESTPTGWDDTAVWNDNLTWSDAA